VGKGGWGMGLWVGGGGGGGGCLGAVIIGCVVYGIQLGWGCVVCGLVCLTHLKIMYLCIYYAECGEQNAFRC